jgi:hypothetical protein
MNSIQIIEEFERSYSFARQMTHDFIKAVPDDKWDFTPNLKYAPLCKQFRHMIWVTGLYRETMMTGNMKTCASKKSHYAGSLERNEILAGLTKQDELLLQALEHFKRRGIEDYQIQALGMTMGFTEFSHILLHHESNHHGMWSMYAAQADFPTPKSWKESWGM